MDGHALKKESANEYLTYACPNIGSLGWPLRCQVAWLAKRQHGFATNVTKQIGWPGCVLWWCPQNNSAKRTVRSRATTKEMAGLTNSHGFANYNFITTVPGWELRNVLRGLVLPIFFQFSMVEPSGDAPCHSKPAISK